MIDLKTFYQILRENKDSIDCICDVSKISSLEYKEFRPYLEKLEKQGKIKQILGCPERCIGIKFLED